MNEQKISNFVNTPHNSLEVKEYYEYPSCPAFESYFKQIFQDGTFSQNEGLFMGKMMRYWQGFIERR